MTQVNTAYRIWILSYFFFRKTESLELKINIYFKNLFAYFLNVYFHSLGVLMWEVFTEGKMPFEKSSNYEVVTMVSQGHRLYRPKLACKQVYEVMMMCWQEVCIFWWGGMFFPLN